MNFIMKTSLKDKSLCDRIINLHNNSDLKVEGRIGNQNGEHVVDKNIKDSIDSVFDSKSIEYSLYFEELKQMANVYIEKFPYSGEYRAWGLVETINIQYYPPNGGYKDWHTERTRGTGLVAARHLAFMTYLNDVTDCGETEFYHQKIKIKPKKGMTVIWPTDWTHTHRGIPSPSQEKYIITGWLSYFE